MALNPNYTTYHPKWYRRRIPIFWWARKLSYVKFISRELTSLFVAYTAVLLLFQAWAVLRSEEIYQRLLGWLEVPAVVTAHVIVLLIVLFHSVTWLGLAPKALVVRLGTRQVPAGLVLAAHYLAWLLVSGLVGWVLLGR